MPERPLLRLPNPNNAEVPGGNPFPSNIRKPAKGRQRDRFAPVFDRLQAVLGRPGEPLELKDDPTALAPERVIVFEIGGTIQNFLKALAKVNGLEFMAELETEFIPSEDFAVIKDGRDVVGKDVPGRLYLAMPDLQALRQLVSLWERWKTDQPLDRGYTPIAHLFAQLHDLRAWGHKIAFRKTQGITGVTRSREILTDQCVLKSSYGFGVMKREDARLPPPSERP